MKYELTACIVLYNNNVATVTKTIESFLNTKLNVKLFLVDNSPTRALEALCTINKNAIEYVFNPTNPGFGAAHNIILNKIAALSPYHIVLNPDIYFNEGVNESIIKYLDKNTDTALVMPKILYPNGSTQHLAKLLPTPVNLIFRRFLPFKNMVQKMDYKYEMQYSGYNTIMNVPYLSGCYMFLRTSVLEEIGYFDDGIFMYLEDADLTRRIHKKYKTIFYPEVSVFHEFEKGSHKSKRLLKIGIESAIYYHNKWGWFFDKERKKINKNILQETGYYNLKK